MSGQAMFAPCVWIVANTILGLSVTHAPVLGSLLSQCWVAEVPSREPAGRQLCTITTHPHTVWYEVTLMRYPGLKLIRDTSHILGGSLEDTSTGILQCKLHAFIQEAKLSGMGRNTYCFIFLVCLLSMGKWHAVMKQSVCKG